MKKKTQRLLHDLISLCSGEIVGKIAGFIAFAYLARTLGTNLYGIVELAVAISVFFMLIINFGYGPIGAREVSKDHSVSKSIVAKIVSARLLIAILTIPIMGITGILISDIPQTNHLIWLFAFALIAIPWDHRWLFQGLEQMTVVTLGQTIRMVTFAIGVIVFVHSSADYWLVGVVEIISAFLMAVFFISMQHYYIGSTGFNFSFKPLQELSKQAASIGLSNAVWAAGQYIPTLLVATLANTEQLAWFGAAHRIAMSMIAFSLIYHFSLFPSVSKRIKASATNFSDFVYPSIKVAAWIGVACALLVLVGSDHFFIYIYGRDFSRSADVLNILIWALPITLLSGHARWALIAAGQQRFVLYAQSCGFITALLVCLVLVPTYHAKGAAFAIVISTLSVWTVAHFNAYRLIGPLPFIEATLRPLLMVGLSLYIFSIIDTPWIAIISALITYALGALIIDWKLPENIKTLINIKDGDDASLHSLEAKGKNLNIRIVLSIVCMIFYLIIYQTNTFQIAHWISPESTGLQLNFISKSIYYLRFLLEIDVIIFFLLMWWLFKSSNFLNTFYYPLWKGSSLNKKQSICDAYFFPILYAMLLLALLVQSMVPVSTLWTNEILALLSQLEIDYGEAVSHYEHNNQQKLFYFLNKVNIGFFGINDFSLYLPSMIIRAACIWVTARLLRHVFNAQIVLLVALCLTVLSHHSLLIENISAHAIVFFGIVLATELFLNHLESGKWRFGIAYALLVGIISWLCLSSIFITVVHALIYLIFLIQTDKLSSVHWRPTLTLLLSGWFCLHFYASFLPQLMNHFIT